MTEHPVRQQIIAVQLPCDRYGNPIDYEVGDGLVTRIEACQKSGEYSNVPYIRVWAGDTCLAEFNQHKASYVRFGPERLPPEDVEINF